jgi:hypothetical protein
LPYFIAVKEYNYGSRDPWLNNGTYMNCCWYIWFLCSICNLHFYNENQVIWLSWPLLSWMCHGGWTTERSSFWYPILDVVLCAIEALSAIDGYSQEICSNKELFRLACDMVKLPDKVEVHFSFLKVGKYWYYIDIW